MAHAKALIVARAASSSTPRPNEAAKSAQLRNAEATLGRAQWAYNAANAEYDHPSLSADAAAKRAQSQIQFEQARLNMLHAERKLAQLSLLAPFDSLVSAVDVKTGESAGPQSTVTRISPTSKLVNGMVTYSVRVTIPAAQSAQPGDPKPGMTANTRIVLERRNDVPLVPNWAVRR